MGLRYVTDIVVDPVVQLSVGQTGETVIVEVFLEVLSRQFLRQLAERTHRRSLPAIDLS